MAAPLASTSPAHAASPTHSARLVVLFALVCVAATALIGRLIFWQILQAAPLQERISAQHERDEAVPARRGSIYDTNMDLLAGNVAADYLVAAPSQIKRPEEVATRLAPVVGVAPESLVPVLSDSKRQWVRLLGGTKLDTERAEQVRALRLPGIYLEPTTRRTYPGGPLAAHLLGFVDELNRGWYGLEGHYGGEHGGPVAGKPGRLKAQFDAAQNEIAFSDRQWQPPVDGMNLVLTLDRTIQYVAERELDRAINQNRAAGGTVIVMDPKTGAVLAMASRPSFDPNRFKDVALQTNIVANPAVTQLYEPGSTFKIITMAAALNERLVTPDTTYTDTGTLSIGGYTLRNWDHKANGVTTMTQLLQKSSNIGAAWVAAQLGPDIFYRYVAAFGFGKKTGIDLQGENGGIVKDPRSRDWSRIDLATNSYGQAISVTPLQLATAVSAIANGGIMMRPFVVRQVVDPRSGQVIHEARPEIVRQVINRESAATLLSMMQSAAEDGETRGTLVPGFKAAGKTGTAQIPDLVNGGYDPKWTIASFVGAVPADDPRFVILVKIDKPEVEPWGSLVAKPAFSIIAQELTRYRRLRPTEPLQPPTPARPAATGAAAAGAPAPGAAPQRPLPAATVAPRATPRPPSPAVAAGR